MHEKNELQSEFIEDDSGSSDVAEDVVNHILDTIKKLETFAETGPMLGHFVPFESDYRMLVAEKYLVFYRISGRDIFINRIIHSRRNYIRILFGEG